MDPKVKSGRPSLLSIESSESGSDAGEGLGVKPYVGAGVALQGPKHAARESNGRARLTPRQAVLFLALGLNPAPRGAAVKREG